MSTDIEQARAARIRAEEDLAAVEAQRPEVEALAARATTARDDFATLMTTAIKGKTA